MTTIPPNISPAQPRASGMAIASLICGIAGFCTAGLGGIVGLILGLVALRGISRSKGTVGGRGLAITGIVLSIVSFLILVAVILFSLLIGMTTVPLLTSFGDQAAKSRASAQTYSAQAQIRQLEMAIEIYSIELGHFPTTEEGGLKALTIKPTFADEQMDKKWSGPYCDGNLRDPWGNLFVYRSPGTINRGGFDLISCGPDGKEGTADDISKFNGF
jgi:general secretion pathway protein G